MKFTVNLTQQDIDAIADRQKNRHEHIQMHGGDYWPLDIAIQKVLDAYLEEKEIEKIRKMTQFAGGVVPKNA